MQTLNLDLCHAGGEREEEPNVLHHKAKRYLGTHPHGSKVTAGAKCSHISLTEAQTVSFRL